MTIKLEYTREVKITKDLTVSAHDGKWGKAIVIDHYRYGVIHLTKKEALKLSQIMIDLASEL